MKKTIVSFIFLFLVTPGALFSQDGLIISRTASVTLDSTDSEVLFLEFYSRGSQAFSSTALNPPDAVRINDQLVVSGRIDSLKASNANDSIAVKIEFLDMNGYIIGSVLWLDFGNNNTSASEVKNTYTPFNRSAAVVGTTSATFWCDVSGSLIPAHGLKFTVTHDGFASANDSSLVRLDVAQGVSALRN